MKISYVLLNQAGKNSSVPRGAAWQSIHQVNDEDQMQLVFEQLQKKIAASDLILANLRINQRDYADLFLGADTFGFKESVIYDKSIEPKRIIHLQEDFDEDALSEE